MKKNFSKILLSGLTLLFVLSLMGSVNVRADETADQTIEVQNNAIQVQLQSNIRTMFCFKERTRLTVCANIGLELDINCEALKIGDKDVIIEVEGDNDLRMTMKCNREESQLGLMNGSLHRARNRNTYRYLEGICISINSDGDCSCKCKCDPKCGCMCECGCECEPECTCSCDCQCNCESECSCECKCQCKCDPECICDCDCQCKCDPKCQCESECPYNGSFLKARLRIRATNQNRLGQWAYYDSEMDEWVTVSTINQDGYLTTETNVLSSWTVLIPEKISSSIRGVATVTIGSIFGILAISIFYLKKRH